jgi:hypothetical protein
MADPVPPEVAAAAQIVDAWLKGQPGVLEATAPLRTAATPATSAPSTSAPVASPAPPIQPQESAAQRYARTAHATER